MAAKKAKPAKKAKKPAYKKTSCPDTPADFFGPVLDWATAFNDWATDVDTCFKTTPACGSAARRAELVALCKAFSAFAKSAKTWGDKVEACYQANCVHGPDHTPPPPSPF